MKILRIISASNIPVVFHNEEMLKIQIDLGLTRFINGAADPKKESVLIAEKVRHAFERAYRHNETWAVTDYASTHEEKSFASQICKGDKVIIIKP